VLSSSRMAYLQRVSVLEQDAVLSRTIFCKSKVKLILVIEESG